MPYVDQPMAKNVFIRTFDKTVDESLLDWHRDYNDRTVRIIKGIGWKLQFDDNMPMDLLEGNFYYIPKNVYHRIIKGNSDLILEIAE